jgi:hypothetical protein
VLPGRLQAALLQEPATAEALATAAAGIVARSVPKLLEVDLDEAQVLHRSFFPALFPKCC